MLPPVLFFSTKVIAISTFRQQSLWTVLFQITCISTGMLPSETIFATCPLSSKQAMLTLLAAHMRPQKRHTTNFDQIGASGKQNSQTFSRFSAGSLLTALSSRCKNYHTLSNRPANSKPFRQTKNGFSESAKLSTLPSCTG